MTAVPHVRAKELAPLPHGFFGRQGGSSSGEFASLNASVSVGDDPARVAQNRALAASTLGGSAETIVMLHQVHSNRVVVAGESFSAEALPQADALVTRTRGLLLCILTADCAPVLLADHEAGVIGAFHAGWKGAVTGVAEATVAAMTKMGAQPARTRAAIGPTISAPNYEVGPDFAAEVIAANPHAASRVSAPNGGREHFDLPGFVGDRLRAAGVGTITDLGICTYGAPDAYFSHRHATHRGTRTGRQMALIGLG